MPFRNLLHTGIVIVLAAAFTLAMTGCGAANALPETVTVELPDGTTQEVVLGGGVPSLADSTWAFSQVVGAGTVPFVTISFGPEGNLDKFEDNTIAPEIFGSTLYFDGQLHATTQPGLSYTAATYGAETNDATGFAFDGVVKAFAAGLTAAEATASASGMFDPDNPDRMTGTFAVTSEVTLISIPEGNIDEEFEFVATRVD